MAALLLRLTSVRDRLLVDPELASPERATVWLERAIRQVHRLAGLAEDLLDVSRIDRAGLTLEPQEFDVAEDARELASRMEERARQSGNRIRVEAGEPVPGRWDRLRLEQVLTNLIENSIRYAPGSEIRVAVEPAGDRVRIAVSDDGPGIDPDLTPRLFDRFERSRSGGGARAGLGLGLYIVRQIVLAHGGEIGLESEPGRGATFRIDLPRR